MLSKSELSIILLHEFKLGCNAAESIQNIMKAWVEKITLERTTRRWFKKFIAGNLSLEGEEGRGRLSLIDNDQLRSIIEADSCKTTGKIAEQLKVNLSTI